MTELMWLSFTTIIGAGLIASLLDVLSAMVAGLLVLLVLAVMIGLVLWWVSILIRTPREYGKGKERARRSGASREDN